MDTIDTQVLLSYVPLLIGDPGTIINPSSEDVDSLFNNTHNGDAKACLWTLGNGVAVPVLVFDNAKDIFNHIKIWSENEPEKWFSLNILSEGSAYALALIPSIEKSCDRWRIAFQLKYGYPPPSTPTRVVFKPLHFMSQSDKSFAKVVKFLPKKTRVGFLDMKHMSNNPTKINIGNVMYLEDIQISNEYDSYLREMIEQNV